MKNEKMWQNKMTKLYIITHYTIKNIINNQLWFFDLVNYKIVIKITMVILIMRKYNFQNEKK